MPSSCAIVGGCARVTLLWQHSANAKRQPVLVLALCLVVFNVHIVKKNLHILNRLVRTTMATLHN